MIQRASAAATAVLCVLLFGSVAAAHSMNCGKPSIPTGTAPSLQQILDGLVVSGPEIDAGAPINVELWTNSAGPLTAQLVVDYTGKKQDVWFGMYDPDSVGNKAFLLPPGVTPSDVAITTFNADQSITVNGPLHKTYQGFDGPFGFFVKSVVDGKHGKGWHKGWWKGGGGKNVTKDFFYTQDALNGGAPRAIVFQGNGSTMLQLPGLAPGLFLPNQFLIAWETGLGDANDGQFNDFLVLVTNIVPVTVPEPAFAFLLGISSLAVLGARRARSALK